ncbi:hypothetical protein RJT34_13596 [Clitoria ternatea]|uniref:t-SNARE coiled-coil homology domain-containing protein n=1 Tax=Clitoria ternatea TaxID=43366 RepID=A0AAN9JNU3_CLITE
MNDLFSSSFKKFSDLNEHAHAPLDDVEAGKESVNLDKFFEDVENVKEEMRIVEKLYRKLQEANEESKIVHNAKTMKDLRSRMDKDVEHVLKQVKLIKGKLEALERSNAANRNIPGCGPGSSADRTRTSVVSGLGKKLKDLMDDFQGLRARMQNEYKETVERRYFTITGEKADEETIENLISSGESESFLQRAIQEQGRGQIMDTISEIQERHDAVKEIEKNLIELHQVFLDMAALVESQGQQLNNIESHVAHASSFVRKGTEQLQEAREIQKDSRKWTGYAIILGIVLIIVLLFPLLTSLLPHLLIMLGIDPSEAGKLVAVSTHQLHPSLKTLQSIHSFISSKSEDWRRGWDTRKEKSKTEKDKRIWGLRRVVMNEETDLT